jgi:RNA methyltransferase, TrmH family
VQLVEGRQGFERERLVQQVGPTQRRLHVVEECAASVVLGNAIGSGHVVGAGAARPASRGIREAGRKVNGPWTASAGEGAVAQLPCHPFCRDGRCAKMAAMPAQKVEITSARNPLVQRFRDAAAGKLDGVLLAEGKRLVGEGLDAGLRVLEAAVTHRFGDESLRQRLQESAATFAECTDEVLARISALETDQGVAVLFERRQWQEGDLLRGDLVPLVLVAAGVRDPGNLGALLRTAEAAGATGLLSLAGGADPFREKAARGSMGSVFRLPVLHGLDARGVVAFAERHRLQLVVADAGGQLEHTAADLRRPTALVLGAEAAGVPPELVRAAAVRVCIRLAPAVESLNVAVAAGVLLFEAARQRR